MLHGSPLVDGCSTAVVPSSVMKYLSGLWDCVFCKCLFQDVICPTLLGADSWGWGHYGTLRLLPAINCYCNQLPTNASSLKPCSSIELKKLLHYLYCHARCYRC